MPGFFSLGGRASGFSGAGSARTARARSMREIADAIGDPAVERVTVLKSARVGYTTVLTSAIAYHHAVKDPAPILVLMPTEADWRDYLGKAAMRNGGGG